ncbi:MAG: universal stress protein [archaeon]
MNDSSGARNDRGLSFETIGVPIASKEDAEVTCGVIGPYLSNRTTVVLIHVIKKAGGGIDHTPVERQRIRGERSFDRCIDRLSIPSRRITTTTIFHTNLVDGILEGARKNDVDAIVFTPRSANRLIKLVSGDTAFGLVHETDRPLLVVPSADGERDPQRANDEHE